MCTGWCRRTAATWFSSCRSGRGSRSTRRTGIWRSRWWWTPSCSGWIRSFAGWTRRTAGSSARAPTRHATRAGLPKAPKKVASTAMSVLQLRGVSKTYGEGAARGTLPSASIDLAVDGGELVAVMGPSGSGKSTLLTIAGSLEQPTSGEVFIDDVRGVRHVTQRACRPSAPCRRLRVPGLQPARRPDRGRERLASLGTGRDAGQGRSSRGCTRRWRSLEWRERAATVPGRTLRRRASTRRDRTRGRRRAHICCSPTNRPARWTRPTARR